MADRFLVRVAKAIRYTITGGEGWMGPGQPLPPSHQELPARRFDYQVAENTAYSPANLRRGKKDGELTYEQLRNLADNYDLLRAVIEYRKGQIAGATWQVLAPDKDPDDPLTPEEQYATDLLQRPTPTDTWQTWLKKVVEELLVVDAVAVYPIVDAGQLSELRLVDGGTMKKLLSETGELPEPPEPAYQQIIKGIVMRDFTSDDLILRHMNPRVSRMYGFSPVEQVVMTTLIALRRQSYQLAHYTEGTIPDAIGTVPETWSPADIRQFQEWFDGALEGSDQRRKMRFVPIDASKVKLLEKKDLADKTDEWFARVICFAFGVDPMFLVSMMNRATSEEQHDAAHEAGILPIFEWVKGLINEIFDRHGLKVRFSWETTSKIDPVKQAEIDQDDVKLGILSLDEVRKKRGYPPLGVPPMVYTPQGPIPVTAFVTADKNPILQAKRQSTPALLGPGSKGGQGKPPPGRAARKALGYQRPDGRLYVEALKESLGIVDEQ